MNPPDPDWRPRADVGMLRTRAAVLQSARAFLSDRGLLEVDTPSLGEFGVTDPHIAGIPVRLSERPGREYFLQTSPEYAMKRLLAAGCPDLYQIGKVFRDGELGSRHQPEFTLAEWYRLGFSLDDMIDETCLFVASLFEAAGANAPDLPADRYRYTDVFNRSIGIDPLTADVTELRGAARQCVTGISDELARQLDADRNGWLDLLMSHVVIPGLTNNRLTIIHHYPAAQGALARLDPEDERFAERFEAFYNGIELANGYRELTDPEQQRARFASDRRRRAAANLADMRADERLLAALDHGLPDCSGVAVGLDRVLMCAAGAATINAVIALPLAD